jgi:hypothetical protein
VRDLLVELVMSDLFRAHLGTAGISGEQSIELGAVGMGRLLSPEQIDRKARSTIGSDLFGNPRSGLGLLYGGFDGGDVTVERNEDITSIMLSAVESRINSKLCDNRIVRNDFERASVDRTLFPYVEEGDAPYPLIVERALWNGIGGSGIGSLLEDIRYPDTPDDIDFIGALDVPVDVGSNYGQRLRALLVPPETGEYRFWVSGDDQVALSLSADESPTNLAPVAVVPGYTSRHDWDKYTEQASVPILLQGGQHYLIELVHKEGGGGDHAAAAWSGPDFERRIISGSDLEASVPVSAQIRDEELNRVRRNIQHLHAFLLGEDLLLDDREIERTLSLFRDVYANAQPETSGLQIWCESRNGSGPARRAWSAVMSYLLTDFRYLNE